MVRISIREDEVKQVVMLGGFLDTPSTPEVEKALTPLLGSVGKDVVIDCIEFEHTAPFARDSEECQKGRAPRVYQEYRIQHP